jgi:hypothetical protein
MHKQLALAALLILPGLCSAQTTQERLLPAQSQVYLRFDGLKAHEQTFRQTAAGKMLQGELGTFLGELGTYLTDLLQRAAQNDPNAGPIITDLSTLLRDLYQNGLVLAVEARQINPPAATAVLVFPGGGREGAAVLPLLKRINEASMAEVHDVKIGKRFVHQVHNAPIQLGWWAEGNDAVLCLGTEEPAAYACKIDAGKTGIGALALYRKVRNFKEFTNAARGYVDIASLAKLVGQLSPEADRLVDELGLKDIASLTYVSGFDGPAQRAVIELETQGQRRGLMSLGSNKTLRLQDLPALPNNASRVTAGTMEIGKSYDVVLQLVLGGVKLFAPAQEDTVKEGIKTVEALLGVDLKKDVFDQFGQIYVSYSSPSEGPLGLGGLIALQVKDGKKLVEALERMTKAAGFVPGLELAWKRQDYKGGEVLQLYLKFNDKSSLIGSFGLYRGWFCYAQFPQSIKGFIMRAEGELPTWRPDAGLQKVLARFPERFTAISISDPRPTVEGLLSLAPFVLNIANSIIVQAIPGTQPFDIALIPHAQEMTQHLFQNVTVTTDNGRVVRRELRASLTLFP